MKKLTLLIVCILCAVSCRTVKEEEINFGVGWSSERVSRLSSDEISNLSPEEIQEIIDAVLNDPRTTIITDGDGGKSNMAQWAKNSVTVFPNPTSSFATIEIDFYRGLDDAKIVNAQSNNFRYSLIFDEKTIHRNEIYDIKRRHEIIPEHLLQNPGMYLVIYEIISPVTMSVVSKGSVSFMVIKSN